MIIPSIDLMDGRAVQLRQGRDLLLTDPRDPVELAREFARYGPVAVVDLDAALGKGDNRELMRACCSVAPCRVGGGIRTEDDVRDWIRYGADKVVLGTMADPEFLKNLPADWIVAAIDAKGDEIVVRGWTEGTGRNVLERAKELQPYVSEFLYTQVRREGMLAGADLETAARLRSELDLPLTVAGGIVSGDEIAALEKLGCSSQLGRAVYEGSLDLTAAWVRQVSFDDRGLVPTVVQDAGSRQVLMLAYSNAASLAQALQRGEGWYWSRSRKELWRKGDTSGNTQKLVSARWDCDRDTVLFKVRQQGPACHTGSAACFGPAVKPVLAALERTLQRRHADPDRRSYTQKLLDDPELLAAKLREESLEVIEAVDKPHVTWECADLLYHLMVRMTRDGITLEQLERELHSRF